MIGSLSTHPARLAPGDEVRVVSPSRSLELISSEHSPLIESRFSDMGLTLSFGAHVRECDQFYSSSIESRVSDLHDAFADTDVNAILTVIGGYNANQLLPYLDWELITAHPKIFCGYSDITALSCAIYAKTGLITYSGPHYSTFGMRDHFDPTLDWFRSVMLDGGEITPAAPAHWTDDPWYLDQDDRTLRDNEGYWVILEGRASGRLVGGNLCTFNLLQGTEFMPALDDTIVFIEDDFESSAVAFDRDLTSLTQQPGFRGVRAILIGRFQESTKMSR